MTRTFIAGYDPYAVERLEERKTQFKGRVLEVTGKTVEELQDESVLTRHHMTRVNSDFIWSHPSGYTLEFHMIELINDGITVAGVTLWKES